MVRNVRISTLIARLIAWLVFRGPVLVRLGRKAFIFNPHTGALTPHMAGAEDPDPDPDPKDPDPDPADPKDPDPDPDPKDPDPDPDPKEDWKSASRKHERRAKTEKQRADDLQAKLDKIASENLSENEKALKTAREEAKAEVTTQYETERRAERLELAVTRSATKGVKLTVDGEEKLVKFADPDDAMAHLERAIKRGDIVGKDIYDDDGRVDTEALTSALVELLEDRPHLRASTASERKGGGDADLGKGKGGGKGLEDMTPEEHLKALQKR